MQKIKEVLSGHNDKNDSTSSTTGTNTHSTTGATTGATGTASRLTGDNTNASSLQNTSGHHSTGTARHADLASGTSGEHTHTSGVTDTNGIVGNLGTGGNTTRSTGVSGAPAEGRHSGSFDKHSHDNRHSNDFDASAATTQHDHKHLQHVEHRDVRHIEVEEVERQREHDRNVHHVQHHVQPVQNEEIREEVHRQNVVPVTNIREQHVSTDEDRNVLAGLASKHRDQETHRGVERTVIDKGETVHENVHHHVHHVTQPVVQTEVQDRQRIHTVIPVHHTTHEAPIVHKSAVHEPIHMSDFKKGGGVLGSGVGLHNANVLQDGECSREVDGVGEKLAQDLHLSSGSHHNAGTTGTTSTVGKQL